MSHNRPLQFAVLLVMAALLSSSALAQSSTFTVGIRDACDPDTFNAAIGPGTCIDGDHGKTPFNLFIGEVTSDRIAGAWRFNPLLDTTQGKFHLVTVNLDSGKQLSLQNYGGETHTFTRVAKYGGGFKARLNLLSGNPNPAPECLQSENPSNIFVEAGTTESGPVAGSDLLPSGRTHWECCIHPWMRMDIVVHDTNGAEHPAN
jgi:hypothetical protein